jgi:signal transduction histidine kinase
MRLGAFINGNMEQISLEWEKFASTLLPDQKLTKLVLRDGILEMLQEIVSDMGTEQTSSQQKDKSEGDAESNGNIDRAAVKHALRRLQIGTTSQQLISEFRALRASIIRLWHQGSVKIDRQSFDDMTRFNEAVDQLLSHAGVIHTQETNRSRELYLGILGHDLRNPLAAISGWAGMLLQRQTVGRSEALASKIVANAARMSHMISDLIELTRLRFGTGIPIHPIHTSMRRICADAIEEIEAIYPERIFQLDCNSEFCGEWDNVRITQVISNLLGNAAYHGGSSFPVIVTVKREGKWLELAVHNQGTTIPPEVIPRIFESLFQGGSHAGAGLGLGLYIVKEIISAYGGTIEVSSSDDEGSRFVARIPHALSDDQARLQLAA